MNFEIDPGFCPKCGTILPMVADTANIKCYICNAEYGPEVYGTMESSYIIYFKSRDAYRSADDKSTSAEGPVVERKCRKCGNEKMSYATLQLRSADEGQTVFYTCTKCKFKESENS